MSKRSDRIASSIRRSVQGAIAKGMSDPRIRGLITVTRVEIGEDLKRATVFVSVLPADKGDLTMHGLRAAAKHIRHQIADDLVLPNTPELVFKLDQGAKQQAEVMAALARVRAEMTDLPDDDEDFADEVESDGLDDTQDDTQDHDDDKADTEEDTRE